MNNKFTILGCGSSLGTPRIDGKWGPVKKQLKIIEQDVALIFNIIIFQY